MGVFLGKPPAVAMSDTGSYVEGSGNTQRRSSHLAGHNGHCHPPSSESSLGSKVLTCESITDPRRDHACQPCLPRWPLLGPGLVPRRDLQLPPGHRRGFHCSPELLNHSEAKPRASMTLLHAPGDVRHTFELYMAGRGDVLHVGSGARTLGFLGPP